MIKNQLFAGIDVGSLTAKAVLIEKEGRLLAWKIISVLPDPVDSAKKVFGEVLNSVDCKVTDVIFTVSTGYGREKVEEAGLSQRNVSEISCHGFGAWFLNPNVRTVIDIGGQDAKVIRVDEKGRLKNFVMNDKCAAGTGQFLEVMSKILGIGVEEIGEISKKSKKPVELSNRCAIYAEIEVIHWLQKGLSREDIAAGINRAFAERIAALASRVIPEKDLMITGGVAKNAGVRKELERMLRLKLFLPDIDPQIMGAYGAALIAREEFMDESGRM